MKKKKVLIVTLMVLTLVLGSIMGIAASERAIVPDMNFVGEPINLTLEDAVKLMQTEGNRAETAFLNKASDEAVAKGHAESVQSMRDYFEKLEQVRIGEQNNVPGILPGSSFMMSSQMEAAGVTETNEKIMKIRRDFAKDQIDDNHKAELNEIEAMTVQLYYGIMLAEENLKIAKDNLANVKKVNDNTQKKYKQGSAARIDTVVSQNQVKQAEGNVATAETSLKNAKMNLNLLLGYDLMQKVENKDKLTMINEPEGNLTSFIEAALDNRNEIKVLGMAYEIQEILLNSLKYRYPENSSTYLSQKSSTLQAKKSYDDIPTQIELDIRSKYMDLKDKKRGVDLAKENLKVAEEAFRLSQISFNAGVNTITDVQEAGIMSYQAALGLAAATTDYNLAVHNFNHAISVGTMRVPL